MIKKRKNVQFFAAAALTAALVTGQFSFATVMGDNAMVQISSLIPDNVTIDQPVPLSDISLPKSDYGTLSWADGSCVPSSRTQSYDVVFRPYNTADLAKISGWDGQSDVIYSSVTVVVSSISKDSDYEGSQEGQEAYTGTEDSSQNTDVSTEGDSANTEENTEIPAEVTETPEITENTEDSETAETKDAVENTEDANAAEVPAEDKETSDAVVTPEQDTEITENPAEDTETPNEAEDSSEDNEAPEVTDTPSATETPEVTVTPEADKDNIFDGAEKEITADDRTQSVEAEAEPSEEEKAQLAETNHTCNGISVSGINLPWYVQFRVASGENYEFTNEAEANVFKSYEFELWDLKNNTEYEIPDGEYLSVTVPVKAGYDYTIEHLLDSGAMETIVPSVEGSTMVFSTHSFSPFGIAGSKTLVGEEIEDGSYSSGTTSTTSATTTPTVTTSANANVTSTANSSTSGSTDTTSVQSASSTDQSSTSDSSDQSATDSSSKSVRTVETGDNTPILPFVIIGIAAGVIVGVLVYLKKKK